MMRIWEEGEDGVEATAEQELSRTGVLSWCFKLDNNTEIE